MDGFQIMGDNGYVKISILEVFGFPDKTSHFGGYEIRTEIEVKSQSYFVRGELWTTTGEIYDFYLKLKSCQEAVKGTATYQTYEGNLDLKIAYDESGHTSIKGEYIEKMYLDTKLLFDIQGDQSYLSQSLVEMKKLVDMYGDNRGIKE